MYVVLPYFVSMEAMVSCLIHGGNISRSCQFHFCRLVGKGECDPCGDTLMLNPQMPLCCV